MSRAGFASVAAAVLLAGCGGHGGRRPAAAVRTAAVERRDLVESTTIDGRLGYVGERTLTAALSGTITWLAPEGSRVRVGKALFRVDDAPVLLLRGARPAWRALSPGITAGRDVRALEGNLRRLGFDPYDAMTVDRRWTSATTAAVERLQKAAGLAQTGTLELGRVVFAAGPCRIGTHKAAVGGAAAGPILTVTGTRREVTADLSTDDQGAARRGDRVQIALPEGRTARGRISAIGAVATTAQDGGATVAVTVRVLGHGVPGLDQAPVSVSLARARVRNAVAVPVVALLGRPGGGYGVQLADGRTQPVTPGLFADGWVQVDGVRPGQRVRVPEA